MIFLRALQDLSFVTEIKTPMLVQILKATLFFHGQKNEICPCVCCFKITKTKQKQKPTKQQTKPKSPILKQRTGRKKIPNTVIPLKRNHQEFFEKDQMFLLPMVLEDRFTNPEGQFQPSVLICGLSVSISKAFCSAASICPDCIFSAYTASNGKPLKTTSFVRICVLWVCLFPVLGKQVCSFGVEPKQHLHGLTAWHSF